MTDLDTPPPTRDGLVVRDNPGLRRYELIIDDLVVGFADYRLHNGELYIPHTEVDPNRRDQGLGAYLVARALDHIRATRTEAVVPACSFVAMFMTDHPDYADLLEPR